MVVVGGAGGEGVGGVAEGEGPMDGESTMAGGGGGVGEMRGEMLGAEKKDRAVEEEEEGQS